MGIGLPEWIIEGKNIICVLGAYGLVFPALIVCLRDILIFKSIKEESSMEVL